MQPVFLEDFDSAEDVFANFRVAEEQQAGVEILFAYYSYENYSGDAFVLFRTADGALWEVNGGHCSCYGLEGQWEPELTSVSELRHRMDQGRQGSEYAYGGGRQNTYGQELSALLDHLHGQA